MRGTITALALTLEDDATPWADTRATLARAVAQADAETPGWGVLRLSVNNAGGGAHRPGPIVFSFFFQIPRHSARHGA